MRYRLTPRYPEAHLSEVVPVLDEPDPAGRALRLPAWTPGSYMIRDLARPVVDLDAADASGPVAVRKVFRDDRLIELGVTPVAPPADRARLEWVAEADDDAVELRHARLGAAA